MKKILFIRSEKANLPEINAYIDYFNKGNNFKAFDSSKLGLEYDINDYDIIWEFKGFGGIKSNNHIKVHEYASLSTGKLSKVKDIIKKSFNPKPNLRIFLNESVRKELNFNDSIEYCKRDMGIHPLFFNEEKIDKEYDYVYIGDISKERKMDVFLEEFIKESNGLLCLIGNYDEDIYEKYKEKSNIIFTGKIPYLEVPRIAKKAVYGINYMPDKYPYNIQTSTKLLEYLAMDLKVITTDYLWIRRLEENTNSNFIKINSKEFNLDIDKLEKYPYESNFDSTQYIWNHIIKKSRIEKKLIKLTSETELKE